MQISNKTINNVINRKFIRPLKMVVFIMYQNWKMKEELSIMKQLVY